MRIVEADVVTSINGRDAGKLFIVVATDGDYSLLADGKGRRMEKPKRKKNKHIRLEGCNSAHIAAKLADGGKVTNGEIRRALAEYAAASADGGVAAARVPAAGRETPQSPQDTVDAKA
jgi:ribosomal protein L14E/L6E/L27E